MTSLMFYGIAYDGPQSDLGYYSFKWANIGIGQFHNVLVYTAECYLLYFQDLNVEYFASQSLLL